MNADLDRLRRAPIAVRARMGVELARLAAARDPVTRPLRLALRTTAMGLIPAAEREWAGRIEARRAELVADRAITSPAFDPGTDGPAGIFSAADGETTVAASATMMSLSPSWCLFLLRLVRELAPRSCLELGSGFGVSAAYQSAALSINGSGKITTLEGSQEIAVHAERTLATLGFETTRLRVGPIAETLAEEVERARPIDFAFVDAEHQAAATLEHFEALLPGLDQRAVLVFDDVNWAEMRGAFAEIAGHRRVAASAVIGRLGVAMLGGEGTARS